jgi:hypothetical protein
MNRKETIEKIYNALLEQGKLTSKPNVLSDDPVEDKVYTKRLKVNKNLGEGVNTIELVYVTVTSSDIDFGNTVPSDMRLNTRNTQHQWCNIFIDEATEDMLSLVEAAIQ